MTVTFRVPVWFVLLVLVLLAGWVLVSLLR